MSVGHLVVFVAGAAFGVGLLARGEQGPAANSVVEPPRAAGIEPEDDGLYADVLGREMGGDKPAFSLKEVQSMQPALVAERREAIANMPARTDLLVMPDGKVHVRVRELWRLSSYLSTGKLLAVPAAAGARANVWWLQSMPGFLPACREFQPVWRSIEGLPEAESGASLVMTVLDYSKPDTLVGSVVIMIPPMKEIPVAQLSAPVDSATVKREVCSVSESSGIQLKLPWPEGVVDAWLAVTGSDGNQIMQGVASRGGTDREVWFWSDLRRADPSWSSIELPKGMDPESVRVEVWWIENTGSKGVQPVDGRPSP